MPQLHRLPPPRVLVTIPSHSLNLPPQNPTWKSMPQLHSFTSPKACFKPPPSKTLHATVFLNFTASPLQDFWARFQVIFLTSPPQNLSCKNIFCFSKASLGWGSGFPCLHSAPVQRKKQHADSCGFIRDYRFHRTRWIWLPTETCHFADNMVTE